MGRISPLLCPVKSATFFWETDYFQRGSSNKAISYNDEHQHPRHIHAIWWVLLLLSGEPLTFTFYFGMQIRSGSLIMSLKFCWHKVFMKKYSLMENSPNVNIGWLGFIGTVSKVLLGHSGSQPSSAKSMFCPSEKAWSLVSLLPCPAQDHFVLQFQYLLSRLHFFFSCLFRIL